MEPRFRPRFSPFFAFLILLLNLSLVSADFSQAYCSNQNTANGSPFFWTWQSNGKCSDYCNGQGTYAFAVIQFTNCWCSNLIPAQQVDMSGCQVNCPGYPDEKCGDKDKGLFIYIKLNGSPSGTQGSSPSSKSSTTLKTTTTPDSMTSIWVVTQSGAIITKTLLLPPSVAPARTGSTSGGSKTGAIAGGVVGGLLALAAIIGGVLFVLWRRRKQQSNEQPDDQVGGPSGITRNASTMSKAGLIEGASKKEMQGPPRIITTFAPHVTRHDLDQISPVRASDHRYSQPVMIDSRLDPRAVLTFHGSNVSRESLASMDDSRDYGRQLNVRNPDLPNRP